VLHVLEEEDGVCGTHASTGLGRGQGSVELLAAVGWAVPVREVREGVLVHSREFSFYSFVKC